MAATLGRQIGKAVANVLHARDRAEMRAVDALLSLVEAPRRKRARTKNRRPTAKRHIGRRTRARRQRRSG